MLSEPAATPFHEAPFYNAPAAALSVEDIADHARFFGVVHTLSRANIELYASSREVFRLTSNLRKFLLTGLLYRAWLRSRMPETGTVFCASQIVEDAASFGLLSRNTVLATLDEFMTYGLLERGADSSDRRVQLLRVPDHVHPTIDMWLKGHLAMLDGMDDGRRVEMFSSRPELLPDLHIRAVEGHQKVGGWRDPPPEVALFYDVKHGYVVMEYLITQLDPLAVAHGEAVVAPVTRTDLARRFGLSRSNIHRIFADAERQGIFRADGRKLHIAKSFLDSYCHWQAHKFAAIEAAWHYALERDAGR